MARIFVGDRSKVNQEVLERVKKLSDDFWVIAEFTLTRNVDWLVLRPMGNAPAVVILVEVKGVRGRLRGSTNGPWQQEVAPGEWVDVEVSNPGDVNYYYQAVNTVNALIEWLRNNAPAIGDGNPYPWSDIRIWPDLLLLSPTPDVPHLLPVAPDNKFGMWFTDSDRWVAHVEAWRPRIGPPLAHRDVENLVRYIGLTPVGEQPPLPEEEPWVGEAAPDLSTDAVGDVYQRVKTLEKRVQRLETMLLDVARALGETRNGAGRLP